MAATIGRQDSRRGNRHEAGARSKRADRRQVRGAGPAERSGDDQHPAEVSLVRLGGARRNDLAHALARQQFEMLTLDLVEQRQRNPDVGDDQIARVRVGWRKDERNLRRAERDRHRRFDGRPLERRAVGGDAGRQIDRHDRDAEPVQIGHDGFEEARERAAEAGSEDGVDDELAIRQVAEVQLPFLRVGDLDDRHADAAEHLEVGPRVAAHVGHTAQQEDGGVDAPLHERSRDHEPVAAVAATAADDTHPARRQVVERRLHGRDSLTPGILHQDDRRDPDVLDRASIRFAHLFGVEHSHGPGRAYCLC